MFRFRALLEQHFEELAALVTREHGKTLAEARAEVQRGIEVVEFACGIPSLHHGRDAAEHRRRRRCRGGPPPGRRLRRHHAVQLPVHGAAVDVPGRAHLRQHVRPEAVGKGAALGGAAGRAADRGRPAATACSTSSTATASASTRCSIIRRSRRFRSSARRRSPSTSTRRGTQHGKRVQSAGGAKNHLIIMPDADLDQTVKALGRQRLRLRRPAVHGRQRGGAVGKAGDPLVEGLVDIAGKMRVGPTDGNEDVDMGPVIRAEHRDRVASYLDIAKSDGADRRPRRPPRLRRRRLPARPERRRPRRARRCACGKEEIFGPVLSVVRAADLDEALAVGDAMRVRQRRRDLHPQRLRGPRSSSTTSTPA